MNYLSVCSGIEAASVAWEPLGWEPLAFSEIEPFPRAVLAHHYPDVPCHGDFTKLRDEAWIAGADILVGGTPCQAFSVAGLRNSLSDDRGNLTLEFVRLADAIDAARSAAGKDAGIVVWENVPGVLSTKDNAFGAFLAGLAGEDTALVPTGGRWTDAGVVDGPCRRIAWRILDAQFFGLAQRRRRVFVVASARDGFDPAAVLLEWEGVRRDTPPRREAGKGTARGIEIGPSGGSFTDLNPTLDARAKDGPIRNQLAGTVLETHWPADLAPTLNAHFGEKQGLEDQHIRGGQGCSFPQLSMCLNAGAMGRCDAETETLIPTIGCGFDEGIAHSLRAESFDASEDGTGRGTPLVPVAFHPTQDPISSPDGNTHALGCGSKGGQASVAVAVSLRGRNGGGTAELGGDIQNALRASQGGGDKPHVLQSMAVRRLTVVECSRLQGFPDDYLLSVTWRGKCPPPDGPMYKALGNSMAVPVMRWIGQRIAAELSRTSQQEHAA